MLTVSTKKSTEQVREQKNAIESMINQQKTLMANYTLGFTLELEQIKKNLKYTKYLNSLQQNKNKPDFFVQQPLEQQPSMEVDDFENEGDSDTEYTAANQSHNILRHMNEVRREEEEKNAREQVRIDHSKQRLQQNEDRARREQEEALRKQQHLQAEKYRMIENDRIKEREKRKAAELQAMHEVDDSLELSWFADEFQHGF